MMNYIAKTVVLFSIPLVAQDQAESPPKGFDVLSVRPLSVRGNHGDTVKCQNGRFTSIGFPVAFIVRWSYQLPLNRILGLPGWASDWDAGYNIEAKTETPVDVDQCRDRAKQMLAEQFKMVSHEDTRALRGFALMLTDGGKRLAESTAKRAGASARMNGQPLHGPEGLSMAELAGYLGAHPRVGMPVIDKTGLNGRFVFDLDFSLSDNDDRPSVFTAVKDLGLKLEATSVSLPVLVVEKIEKANPN
ncbi:MAG: TIGR03435 family protein [Bryobacteraceae bacterium]|jgi:uncharacterized protein (TIGR03435 family)